MHRERAARATAGSATADTTGAGSTAGARRRGHLVTTDLERPSLPGARPWTSIDGGPDDRDRLRALLVAYRAVSSEPVLADVLQTIVGAARDLVDARYAALGVLGPDGGLAEFVHVGVDEATAARIGAPPRGRGIPGLVTAHRRPLRLDDLGTDPASVGFPDGHPPMRSFLGVPVRIGGEVFGHICATEKRSGAPAVFTAGDEELMVALAGAAAIAIGHARAVDVVARQAAPSAEPARSRDDAERLRLLDEQDRIAVAVHELVLGRLFRVGLGLHGLARWITDADGREAVARQVAELDRCIKDLRSAIYAAGPGRVGAVSRDGCWAGPDAAGDDVAAGRRA